MEYAICFQSIKIGYLFTNFSTSHFTYLTDIPPINRITTANISNFIFNKCHIKSDVVL